MRFHPLEETSLAAILALEATSRAVLDIVRMGLSRIVLDRDDSENYAVVPAGYDWREDWDHLLDKEGILQGLPCPAVTSPKTMRLATSAVMSPAVFAAGKLFEYFRAMPENHPASKPEQAFIAFGKAIGAITAARLMGMDDAGTISHVIFGGIDEEYEQYGGLDCILPPFGDDAFAINGKEWFFRDIVPVIAAEVETPGEPGYDPEEGICITGVRLRSENHPSVARQPAA